MKIFVLIKQVPDTETKIKLKADASGIDETGVKWVMNPYDEFAVEEALKVKEKNPQATVTVMTLGPKRRAPEVLRTALAMGADDAILIDADEAVDCWTTAQALAKAIQAEGAFELIFTGKLAIDDNMAAVSQMVAECLQIPHTTVINRFTLHDGAVEVEREVEGGTREVVRLQLPCLVGCNKGLNTPRYASLPGIMKAKKKPLKEISLDTLGLSSGGRVKFKNYLLPSEKPPVKILSGDTAVHDLVQLLRDEAKVL
jgi:electron transfer flavoprotein beta subunit